MLPNHAYVPGIVINHSPASSGRYVGSPSIVILADGSYLASHDFFGPNANHETRPSSVVFSSADRGKTWQKSSEITPLFWGQLFVHKEMLYILGTRHEYGDVLIRRSDDGGQTWTEPDASTAGLLRKGDYHCAPCSMVVFRGRLWRSFEIAEGERPNWAAIVISAPIDSDLLNADNWQFSRPFKHAWSQSQWIEGSVVVTPQGELVNILRTNGQGDDRAAITHVSEDGLSLFHDREHDIIDFPGGGVKFTIRFDAKTSRYWSIVSKQTDPSAHRNNLVLIASENLRNWTVVSPLLYHPDAENVAWQYIDRQFDGQDIIFASRTAYDDGLGGAYRAHDANYLTFHRIPNFRTRRPGLLTAD